MSFPGVTERVKGDLSAHVDARRRKKVKTFIFDTRVLEYVESVEIIVNKSKKSSFGDYILNMALLSEWSKELDSSSSMYLHARVQIPHNVFFFTHSCNTRARGAFWQSLRVSETCGRRQSRQREALVLILLPGVFCCPACQFYIKQLND